MKINEAYLPETNFKQEVLRGKKRKNTKFIFSMFKHSVFF